MIIFLHIKCYYLFLSNYLFVLFEIQMAILEETYNYEQNIAKIFSDHNVRESLISEQVE